jgi:hypothetical protein
MTRQNTLDQLEPRQMLSVTLSNLRIDDAAPSPGQAVVVSVDTLAGPGETVRAATFFRDLNANGRWDAGVDQDLGSTTTRTGGTFRKTMVIPTGWTGTARILANAVTTTDQWSANPASLDLRVNQRPRVEDFGVVAGTQGTLPRGYARVSDDSRARAVTFFLDRNNNGRWDSGLDDSLGTVFQPDGDGVYRRSLPADPATWPAFPRIGIDVVDDDGDWSSGPRSASASYHGSSSSTPPTVSNLQVRQDWARSDGKRITLSVDAVDNSAVRAVTFYADRDDNGQWTPGVDDSLGTSYRASSGHMHTITITTDFGGSSSVRIIADASDYDDKWAPDRRSGSAQNGGAFVEEFEAHTDEGTRVEFEMKYEFPRYFGRTPPASLNYFLFLDANKSGGYEPGADTVLDSGTAPVDPQDGDAQARPRLDLGSLFRSDNWYGTAVTSVASGDFTNAIISPVRLAVQRSADPSQPRIESFDSRVGGSGEIGRVGSTFTLSGDFTAPRGARAISFFWDKNLNGMWDTGTDIDLGWQAASGTSGVFSFQGAVRESMIGFGSFTAVLNDASSGVESWSMPVSDDVTQIFAAPRVRGVTGQTLNVPAGSPITIDVAFSDDSGVRAATAFIDTNGDGLLNGSDSTFSASAFSLYSGSRSNGTMRLTLATTGLARGVYTMYVAVSDSHRGDDSAPGGRVNGLWSTRYAVQVTIV